MKLPPFLTVINVSFEGRQQQVLIIYRSNNNFTSSVRDILNPITTIMNSYIAHSVFTYLSGPVRIAVVASSLLLEMKVCKQSRKIKKLRDKVIKNVVYINTSVDIKNIYG